MTNREVDAAIPPVLRIKTSVEAVKTTVGVTKTRDLATEKPGKAKMTLADTIMTAVEETKTAAKIGYRRRSLKTWI